MVAPGGLSGSPKSIRAFWIVLIKPKWCTFQVIVYFLHTVSIARSFCINFVMLLTRVNYFNRGVVAQYDIIGALNIGLIYRILYEEYVKRGMVHFTVFWLHLLRKDNGKGILRSLAVGRCQLKAVKIHLSFDRSHEFSSLSKLTFISHVNSDIRQASESSPSSCKRTFCSTTKLICRCL